MFKKVSSLLLTGGVLGYSSIRTPLMASQAETVYEFVVKNIDGQEVSLEKYRGEALLIVNVASKWGMTNVSYTQMVELHNKYAEKGFNILAFPCNQFGGQEPGTEEEIKKFAEGYGVKFDMFSKVKVNGDEADPLWKFLKQKQGGLMGDFIKWNFTKFIVDREGNPVARFSPKTNIIPDIEEQLLKYL